MCARRRGWRSRAARSARRTRPRRTAATAAARPSPPAAAVLAIGLPSAGRGASRATPSTHAAAMRQRPCGRHGGRAYGPMLCRPRSRSREGTLRRCGSRARWRSSPARPAASGSVAAELFAAEGARVVIADVVDDARRGTRSQAIRGAGGGDAAYVHADVSDADQAAAMVALRRRHLRRPARALQQRRHPPARRRRDARHTRGHVGPGDGRQPQGRVARLQGRHPRDARRRVAARIINVVVARRADGLGHRRRSRTPRARAACWR